MNRISIVATLVVVSAWGRTSAAQVDPKDSELARRRTGAKCFGPIDADAVARCALEASPEVREARARLDAAAARRSGAGVVLPSNPTLSTIFANRRRPPPEAASVLNWNVTISQELEIAGQRGARIEAADADLVAQTKRVGVAEQEVAAGALTSFYEAVASQEALRFAEELAANARALAAYAEGRAKEAIVAGVEADVARAEATRIGLLRFEAERRLTEARATLAALLDVDTRAMVLPSALPASAAFEASGDLEQEALRVRGEVAAAEMERRVLERRLALVRRERIPNPTLSAFIERGEINDRIIGVGLSFPVPLPSPIGRTRAAEIAETMAGIRAAESSSELVRRRVRIEVSSALAALKAREGAAALFQGDLVGRARADLSALREAIETRQLSLREGLQWQRSLIELLQADIDVRLGRALALVDLRRVAGLPLSSGMAGVR